MAENEQQQISRARKLVGIREGSKCLLCLDGGGIRGILPIQVLKNFEQLVGIPCYKFFDMVVGTSTGGIIAALIASGKTAKEIEQLYEKCVHSVFEVRSWRASRYYNPPLYSKEAFRKLAYDIFGNITLKRVTQDNQIDIMITAKDVIAGEETFFTSFGLNDQIFGTYNEILLRAAVEATMSAPTYFSPLGRFVDGGVTCYNDPTLAALTECTKYQPQCTKYKIDNLTVFSFGTGCRSVKFITQKEIKEPKGIDVIFWLNWLMEEGADDSSDMQTYFLRSNCIKGLDYRRFQVSLHPESLKKMPDEQLEIGIGNATWLHELTKEDIGNINLDDVRHFSTMKTIGKAMANYIKENNGFKKDLVDEHGKDLLVIREGNISKILQQLKNPELFSGMTP